MKFYYTDSLLSGLEYVWRKVLYRAEQVLPFIRIRKRKFYKNVFAIHNIHVI